MKSEFKSFCRENRKTILLLVAAVAFLFVLQGVKGFLQSDMYIKDDHGNVVAIKRETSENSLSVPLCVQASKGGLQLEEEILLTLKGELEGKPLKKEEDDPLKPLGAQIRKTVKELEQSREDYVLLPQVLDDGTKLSWKKGADSESFVAVLLLLPLGMLLLYRNKQEKINRKRRDEVEMVKKSLPGFNNQLLLLLGSGLIFSDAFSRIAQSYASRENPGYFGKILLDIEHQSQETGQSTVTMLNNFAKEVGIREFTRIVSIISENQYKGVNLMEKLEEESELLWMQRKKLAEEKGRLAETKLSFPLAILLLVLILITAAPAVLQI